MVCTEGNTNRECSFFLGGVVDYRCYRGYRNYRGYREDRSYREDSSYRGGSTAWIGGMEDFGVGEDFFVGLQNFIYFWKLKLEMGLSTSAFCPWLAQQQCGYRLIISI